MPTFKPTGRKMHVLISGHRDGVLISRVIRFFGIDTVVGSSSKGSLAALRAIKEVLKRGDNLSVTPDGPRGPNRVAAAGIVYAAQISGLPIVPVSFSAVAMKRLGSWDKFCIPLPFTRVTFVAAEPIIVPRTMNEAEMESYRLQVEQTLNRITDVADAETGHLQHAIEEKVAA